MADNDALDAALAQFNEGLRIQEAEDAAKRAVDKAERKKQQAASELKKLQSDPNASAEDKTAADEAYRTAVDEFNKLRSGETDDAAETDDVEADEAEAGNADAGGESADEENEDEAAASGSDEPEATDEPAAADEEE